MTQQMQAQSTAHEVVRVHEDGLPVYRLGDRPAHLLTRRELNRAGLARAYRQPHLAYARWYYYKQEGETPLYDRASARPKKECSAAQLAALERGRKDAEHRAFLARAWTCFDCGKLTDEPHYYDRQIACGPCETIRHQVRELVLSLDLAPVLPSDASGKPPADPQRWATAVLDSTVPVGIDTETSALHGWVVDLAVHGIHGRPVLDTLVTPQGPISEQSKAIHGIGADMLHETNAPTFSGVLAQLGDAIDGRCVVVYNLSYDLHVIAREVDRHARLTTGLERAEALAYTGAWLQRARWVDLMLPYSEWYGEWNSHHHDYRWKQLPYGDHRAASDAAGVVRLLRELADGTAPRLPDTERGPQGHHDCDYYDGAYA